jgi:hypothetical protein
MEGWSFLTKHGRVLLCIAHGRGGWLRDVGARVGITGRSACGIVAGLAAVGCAVKREGGRCNRYQVRAGMALPGPVGRRLAIGGVLAVLAGAGAGRASWPGGTWLRPSRRHARLGPAILAGRCRLWLTTSC